jgi:hypothetical protein
MSDTLHIPFAVLTDNMSEEEMWKTLCLHDRCADFRSNYILDPFPLLLARLSEKFVTLPAKEKAQEQKPKEIKIDSIEI